MKLINYELSGVVELFRKLLDIDYSFSQKGKSDQSSTTSEGRVQLGANANSILSMISANFVFDQMTFFDIETMKAMATSVEAMDLQFPLNPMPCELSTIEEAVPDLFNYIKETNSVLTSLKSNTKYEDIKLLYPIGCFKFKAIVSFRGKDILLLFNGFLENYLYSKFKTCTDVTNEAESIIKRDTLKNLMDSFMKNSYQASQKPSLIEDFIIQKEFYSYIKNTDKYAFSLGSISYPGEDIRFYGGSSATTLQLTNFKKFIKEDSGLTGETNTILTFGVISNIHIFMILKLFGKSFKIIANQKYDILYSDTKYQIKIDPEIQSQYGLRINSMLNHNTECRNIVIHDVNTSTNLSHPSSRYGMILTGQKIKYLIQISVSELNDMGICFPDSNIPYDIITEASELVSAIKKFATIIESQYIGLLNS